MLSLGSVLHARYRVDRMLEIGALEGQYRGWDLEENVPVIIKELLPQPDLDPAELKRLQALFAEDADRLMRLRHPHIVRVLDHFCTADSGSADGLEAGQVSQVSAYLILQEVPGQTLAALIERDRTLDEKHVASYAKQLLSALAYCHTRGVTHRDIRPDNIVITPDDQALLTNFEIVALWNTHDPRTWTAKRVMGTPQYAPPETWGMKNTHVDARSDIYSLGATLYHALTGEQPLTAGERTSNPYRFLQVKALAPRVNQPLRTAILKAMELPRDKRYQSAADMATALAGEHAAGRGFEPPPAPFLPSARNFPWTRALGLLTSAAVLFAAGLLGTWLNQNLMPNRRPVAPAVVATPAMTSPTANVADVLAAASPVVQDPDTGNEATPATNPIAAADLTATPTPPTRPRLTATAAPSRPTPPAGWQTLVTDDFEANTHGWLISDHEDDWGSVSRQIVDGSYRWDIVATQAVGRWCTPELGDDTGIVGDFYAAVDARRIEGPTTAAYGLILHQDEGSYYLFSLRDDGFFQFNLWYGYAWQTIIDWTQTGAILSGETNHLTVTAVDNRFELFINDELVAEAENDQLPLGDVGLAISTAATDGPATFTFDNFALWAPPQ